MTSCIKSIGCISFFAKPMWFSLSYFVLSDLDLICWIIAIYHLMFQICQIYRCKSRQILGVQGYFVLIFPTSPESFYAINFVPTYFLQLLIYYFLLYLVARLKNRKFPYWILVLNPTERSTLRTLLKTSWLSTLEHLPHRFEFCRFIYIPAIAGNTIPHT